MPDPVSAAAAELVEAVREVMPILNMDGERHPRLEKALQAATPTGVPIVPAPARVEDPQVGDRVLIAGVDSLAGQIGSVVKVYDNREIVHVRLEAGGATVSALAQDLHEPPAEPSLTEKVVACREAAKRASDPVTRDAFNEAADWFEERAETD